VGAEGCNALGDPTVGVGRRLQARELLAVGVQDDERDLTVVEDAREIGREALVVVLVAPLPEGVPGDVELAPGASEDFEPFGAGQSALGPQGNELITSRLLA